jgi:diacylglycerol kinase (ATP)
MQLKNVALIFNPKGGSARRVTVEKLVSSLMAAGVHVACGETTADPGSARYLASKAADGGVDLVVAMGGDGTVRQVAEALMGTDTPMAVFPGGTGNLFAQNFMAPPPPAEFARMLLTGVPQPIDLFQYEAVSEETNQTEKGVFLVGLGFGPLSDAISEASPKWKKRFGRLVYAVNVAKAAFRPKGTIASFAPAGGGEVKVPVAAAFALNVVPHTMPFLSRGCTPSDGLIDLVVVKGKHFHQILGCGACLTAMRPERSRHYQRLRTSDVRVETNRPVTLNVDGDPGPTTRQFRLSVLPEKVKMVLA